MDNIVHSNMDRHRELYKDIHIPKHSKYAAVIVEPRCHVYLEFVIKNATYFLPDWSLYIFHSKQNKDFVSTILGHNRDNVHMIEFCLDNISIPEYNRLLTSPGFYKKFQNAKYILIFQTDSYICRFGIESYVSLDYDYIGAPWLYESYIYQTGNGGLSLRKVKKMIEITENIVWNGEAEDLYFNSALQHDGKIPNKFSTIAQSFSVESIFHPNPFGTHKTLYSLNIHFEKIDECIVIEAFWTCKRNKISVKELIQQTLDTEKTIYSDIKHLGDPFPNVQKYLICTIRINGIEKKLTIEENKIIDVYQII